MAERKTLGELLKGLRAELRHALDPNLAIETTERFTILLNDIQRELWMDNDWDHLKVYRYIAVRKGERYYDFPSDIDVDRTYQWEYKFNTVYYPMVQGISRLELTAIDSERGQQSDPLRKFDFHHDDATDQDQFEVFPTPASDGTVYDQTQPAPARETEVPNRNADGNRFIRLRAIRKLNEMSELGDKCDLDARLLVLVAAATEAEAEGSNKAGSIAARAAQYKQKLIGRLKKHKPFLMGTDMDQRRTVGRSRRYFKDIRYAYGAGSP